MTEDPGNLWAVGLWCRFHSLWPACLTGSLSIDRPWTCLHVGSPGICNNAIMLSPSTESNRERGTSQNPFGKHFTNVIMWNNQGGWCCPYQELRRWLEEAISCRRANCETRTVTQAAESDYATGVSGAGDLIVCCHGKERFSIPSE